MTDEYNTAALHARIAELEARLEERCECECCSGPDDMPPAPPPDPRTWDEIRRDDAAKRAAVSEVIGEDPDWTVATAQRSALAVRIMHRGETLAIVGADEFDRLVAKHQAAWKPCPPAR